MTRNCYFAEDWAQSPKKLGIPLRSAQLPGKDSAHHWGRHNFMKRDFVYFHCHCVVSVLWDSKIVHSLYHSQDCVRHSYHEVKQMCPVSRHLSNNKRWFFKIIFPVISLTRWKTMVGNHCITIESFAGWRAPVQYVEALNPKNNT